MESVYMQQKDSKPVQINADKNYIDRIKRKAKLKALKLVVMVLVVYVSIRIFLRRNK